jgi:hypothetical protein
MSKNLTKNISELNDSAKKYLQTKVDLIKVSLLEKSTKLASFLINILILVWLLIWVLGFAVAAFAVWYGKTYNNYSKGLLIAGGIMLFTVLLFIIFRKNIVTTAVLQYFSKIIFEDENDEKI